MRKRTERMNIADWRRDEKGKKKKEREGRERKIWSERG